MVAIAEVPDKTAIASMLLGAGRYPVAVFIGVAGAFVIQSAVAVAFGSTISLIPGHVVHLLAGILFIVFAVMMWWRSMGSGIDDEHSQRSAAGFWSAAGSAFLVIFIAEWGDLTQLATAALAAEHPLPLTIFCAATLALWLVSAVAIWLGHRLRASLPVRLLQRIAAVAFPRHRRARSLCRRQLRLQAMRMSAGHPLMWAASLVAGLGTQGPLLAAEDAGPAPAAGASAEPALPTPGPTPPTDATRNWSLHAQSTLIMQHHNDFHSPYAGPESVPAREGRKTSLTGTINAGYSPWHGTQLELDPEVAGGEGIGNVAGIAGYPNGDIARVSTPEPEPYFARIELRQTFDLGGATVVLPDGPGQVATTTTTDRLVQTHGRFSATDIFDGNAYSHAPRSQFENETLMDDGAWDYPPPTHAATPYRRALLEYVVRDWTERLGAFQEPARANGQQLDSHIAHAFGLVSETERRWSTASGPGSLRLLLFENHADMGEYRTAIQAAGPGTAPNLIATRSYRSKYGAGVNADQQLGEGGGIFARVGWNDGHTETWAFTEIDRNRLRGRGLERKPLAPARGYRGTGPGGQWTLKGPSRLPGGGRPGLHARRWPPDLCRGAHPRGLLPCPHQRSGAGQPRLPGHRQSGIQSRPRTALAMVRAHAHRAVAGGAGSAGACARPLQQRFLRLLAQQARGLVLQPVQPQLGIGPGAGQRPPQAQALQDLQPVLAAHPGRAGGEDVVDLVVAQLTQVEQPALAVAGFSRSLIM